VRTDKRASSHKADKKNSAARHRQGVVGYSKKSALLEEAITHMNAGKYGRSSAALKELLALDPQNIEARRLFATLHLRLGSLVTAREAFEALANEAIGRQDYWLAESLLREYLAAGPRCIPFLELLAHVYEEKGDAMAAVGELGKAIEILLEDPDPDNPKKPSQFYAKIRELAPASPVAFQFASLFDFQSGEFRIPQTPPPDHVSQAETALQAGVLSSVTRTMPPTEIMPWEQIDELPIIPTPADAPVEFADTEPGLIEPSLGSLPFAGQAHPAPMPVGESLSENEFGPECPITTAATDSLISESVPATQVPPFTIKDSVGAIGESSPTKVTSHDTLVGPTPEISTEATATVESSPVLSRMPWEHVADPALQIVEPEPTIKLEPTPETVMSTQTLPLCEPEISVSVSPSAEMPVNIAIPFDAIPAATPGGCVSVEAGPVQVDTQHVEPLEESVLPESIGSISESLPALPSPSSDASSPTSFSWKEIFDSAWKFTVGTTAPSPSIPVKDPEETVAQELQQPVERFDGPPQSIETPAESIHEPVDTFSASVLSLSVSEQGRQNGQTSVDAVPEAEPIPPSPSSFSLVVEDQIIPARALEPVAAELPSTGPSTSSTVPDAVEHAVSFPQPAAIQDPSQPATGADSILDPVLPTQSSSPPLGHWDTGEVAVQPHRPSKKKHQWDKEPAEMPAEAASGSSPKSVPEEERATSLSTRWASTSNPSATVPTSEETAALTDTRPEWEKATDSILLDQPVATDAIPTPVWEESSANASYRIAEPQSSPAAIAVDVLFGSTGRGEASKTTERFAKPRPRIAARLARLRQALTSLILSGFSTTRAFVVMCISLVVLCAVTAAAGIGAVALLWTTMEEPPTQRYQSLTTVPQRQMIDSRKNGFMLLMGFDASAGQDALQTGYERRPTDGDVSAAKVCMVGYDGKGTGGMSASFTVINGWFKEADPLAQLKAQSGTAKSVLVQQSVSLGRYQQWLPMPFEDWGFGQMLSPDCPRILLAHRLYLLEGLMQDTATAVGRLEKDMEAWRVVLGQSKTLMMKMLAAMAVQDDALLASGLLTRPDTDMNSVNRLSKVVRPLDQVELSVRWPMQSHFVWAARNVSAELKKDRTEERPIHVSLAAAMPLPVQRRANAYAEYYDAANRAFAEGRYANLPKPTQFMRPSASSVIDYLANPIEHVIGIEPLPPWDPYVGRMVEIDAQLRLASLQAWVRRGSQDGNVLARLAKAGQAYYDPFTGLPMLVNQQKRLLYSVGRDGKDQEGDPRLDVVVGIPPSAQQSPSLEVQHLPK
jgi:hypothetical protein